MTNSSTPNHLIGFIFVFSTFLFFACTNNSATARPESSSKIDSVRIFIAQSKQKELSHSAKSRLLNKAFSQAKSSNNDSLKCSYYSEISFRSMRVDDSLLFRKVNKEGIDLAKKRKDYACLSNLQWDLGDFYKYHAVPDSAYFHYVEVEKLFTQLDDDFSSGRVLISMARIQNEIGDYTGSEITTIKAIAKLKPLNKNRQLALCYDNLGDVTKLLNDYDRALEYYNQYFMYLKKAKLGVIEEQKYKNNVGLVYQKMGRHEKAVSYFSAVVGFDSLRYKDPLLYSRALNNLGFSYLRLNKKERLPQLFKEALKIQDSINDVTGKTSSILHIAKYHLSEKDSVNTVLNLKKARTYAQQSSSNKQLLEVLRLFSRADPKNAIEYGQAYVVLTDSLQKQERQLRDKFARIQFETDEFIAENQLLERQKQLLAGIVFTVLLLSAAAFIIISQRTKNQKLRFQQAQQANNQEIFNLMLSQNEKFQEGKQMEQKRISEELHDGVQGRLQGARMMLLGLNKRDDDMAKQERGRAIVMLKDIQEEVRSISHELSHAAYQKIHNFILSLEDLKTNVEKAAAIEIQLNYTDALDWDILSGDIKINLYRIIQESLQNSVKHAESTSIKLDLKADAAHLKVSITDNGKGFIVKKGKKGIGMRNIESRMKKVNGTWNIESTIGKGTLVTLKIPIVENDENNRTTNGYKNLQPI